MSPKEQASALVDKFYGIRCFPDDHRYDQEPTCHHQAKECAIICVEQIIDAIPLYRKGAKETFTYWHEVLGHLKNS